MDLPKTRIDLGVDDANRSAAFYEALLGAPPASRDASVTIFESDAPPLLLVLQKRVPGAKHRRSERVRDASRARGSAQRDCFALVVPEPEHVGKAAVALWRAGAPLRLKDAGIEAQDPDGNAWQVRFVPYAKTRAVISLKDGGANEGG